MSKDWKYFWNDTEVSKEEYDKLCEEHRKWVLEEEKKLDAATAPEKKSRKTKNEKSKVRPRK